MMEQNKKRKDWCDLARGLMMFLVFVYHSEVYYGDKHTGSWFFSPFFLTGFVFVSGYLFCSDISQVSLRQKCLQVIRSIAVPYLCFMFLFFIPKALFVLHDAKQQLIDILLFRASWFVIVIGVLQILFALILQKVSIKRLIGFTVIFFVVGYLTVVWYRTRPDFIFKNMWLESIQLPGRMPFCINIALALSPFFTLGILYRKYEHLVNIPISWNALTGTVLLYVVLWGFDHRYIHSSALFAVNDFNNILLIYLFAVIGIVCVIIATKLIQKISIINYIGKHSLLFYYFNGMALTLLVKANDCLHVFTILGYFEIFVFAVLACLICFPISYCINRWLPLFVGSKSAYNKLSSFLGLKIKC